MSVPTDRKPTVCAENNVSIYDKRGGFSRPPISFPATCRSRFSLTRLSTDFENVSVERYELAPRVRE